MMIGASSGRIPWAVHSNTGSSGSCFRCEVYFDVWLSEILASNLDGDNALDKTQVRHREISAEFLIECLSARYRLGRNINATLDVPETQEIRS